MAHGRTDRSISDGMGTLLILLLYLREILIRVPLRGIEVSEANFRVCVCVCVFMTRFLSRRYLGVPAKARSSKGFVNVFSDGSSIDKSLVIFQTT